MGVNVINRKGKLFYNLHAQKRNPSKKEKQIQSSLQHKTSSSITKYLNTMYRLINIKFSVLIQKATNTIIDMLQLKINNIISLIVNFKQECITVFDNDIQS